ncbi:unnamed protein product [Ixodes persulcatus]
MRWGTVSFIRFTGFRDGLASPIHVMTGGGGRHSNRRSGGEVKCCTLRDMIESMHYTKLCRFVKSSSRYSSNISKTDDFVRCITGQENNKKTTLKWPGAFVRMIQMILYYTMQRSGPTYLFLELIYLTYEM